MVIKYVCRKVVLEALSSSVFHSSNIYAFEVLTFNSVRRRH